jgi:basic membrane lipoprotein Med (substrate-binding protein (PBP1-ABC) superfamily)
MELEKVFTYGLNNQLIDILEADYPALDQWKTLKDFIRDHGRTRVLTSLVKRYGVDLINIRKMRCVGKNKEKQIREFFGLNPVSNHSQFVMISLHDFMEYQELKKKHCF